MTIYKLNYGATIPEIKEHGFSMPYLTPSAPQIDYHFTNREYLIITYESELNILQKIVPEPLQVVKPNVRFEFINMPDAHGFGAYSTVGQMIEVEYQGVSGWYAHAMYLDNLAPIAAGREIWGFPEKLGNPKLEVVVDTLVGSLKYNSSEIAIGTMGYKYHALDKIHVQHAMEQTPNFLLKIIPDISMQKACICQLVRYFLKDVQVVGAWSAPASLQLFEHALAPVKQLPIKRILAGQHIIANLTLGFGEIVYDYLA